MDMVSLINPIIISATIGMVIAILLVVGLVRWHQKVLNVVVAILKAVFTWTGFFWLVNFACMAYSAQNAGYIFGLYEATGVLVGVAIDGLIIAFTQTMLAAKARGERKRATQIMLFIVFCCLLSTLGNLAHNLHTDIGLQTSGVWFSEVIPYAVSTMPLFLIALAWVADLKVNPLNKENADSYRENEDKQIEFQRIQIESSEKREALQTRDIALEALRRRNKALRKGKVPGSFRWFWEKYLDAGEIIAGVTQQLKALFDPKLEAMQIELEKIQREKEELVVRLNEAQIAQSNEIQVQLNARIEHMLSEICADLLQQNEQHKMALAQQYDRDITTLGTSLNERFQGINRTLAEQVQSIVREYEWSAQSNADDTNEKDADDMFVPVVASNMSQASVQRSSARSKRTRKTSRKRRSTVRSSAFDLISEILKDNPHISVGDIVNRTGLAKSTVSTIRTRILEHPNGSDVVESV